MTGWLHAGAPDDPAPPVSDAVARQVSDGERFLDGDSPKARLMSRDRYEHPLPGNLMFEGDARRRVLRLLRSATPPGSPVQLLATWRPCDRALRRQLEGLVSVQGASLS